MSNRFSQVFSVFEKNFAHFLKDFKEEKFVFCLKINEQGGGEFRVYRDMAFDKKAFPDIGYINPMHDMFHNNTIWFFYEQDGVNQSLEALVNYLDDHRPRFCIGQEKPVFIINLDEVPYVEGIAATKRRCVEALPAIKTNTSQQQSYQQEIFS